MCICSAIRTALAHRRPYPQRSPFSVTPIQRDTGHYPFIVRRRIPHNRSSRRFVARHIACNMSPPVAYPLPCRMTCGRFDATCRHSPDCAPYHTQCSVPRQASRRTSPTMSNLRYFRTVNYINPIMSRTTAITVLSGVTHSAPRPTCQPVNAHVVVHLSACIPHPITLPNTCARALPIEAHRLMLGASPVTFLVAHYDSLCICTHIAVFALQRMDHDTRPHTL